ncbi:hypothetical protein RC32_01005 [Campylobacter jejuni]|nr:hypothetical protein RC32_01005 [Campylobacter jejuni]
MKQGDFTEVAKHYHNRPAYSPFLLEKLVVCINDKNKNLKDLNIVAQIDQTTKDNVEIANESAIISSTVSDIANNILEDVKKKRF